MVDEWLAGLSDSELQAQVTLALETMQVLQDDSGRGPARAFRGAGAVWLLLKGQGLLLEKLLAEQRRRGMVP